MHLEVKVALNFIVSYLYNKLPRRRADLFGEELERILVSRFEGHWYPEAPLRGSGFRCIHLGSPRDPVVELAAQRSGLDTEEVCANVPPELSVWIDPYEVSYQIGEKGSVKVLYLEDPPGLGCEGPEEAPPGGAEQAEAEEAKNLSFNPDAQVFVPVGGQPPACGSPLPAPPAPGLFSYPGSTTPPDMAVRASSSTAPSPTGGGLPYMAARQPPARPQPITFTTASFAATKFGSTKMKKCGGAGSPGSSGAIIPPPQRVLSRSPSLLSAPELHKPLSVSLHALGGPALSQLSPGAKEFVYPGSPGSLYFDSDARPVQRSISGAAAFDAFSGAAPQSLGAAGTNGGVSFVEKAPFDALASFGLQYSSQAVVLAT